MFVDNELRTLFYLIVATLIDDAVILFMRVCALHISLLSGLYAFRTPKHAVHRLDSLCTSKIQFFSTIPVSLMFGFHV